MRDNNSFYSAVKTRNFISVYFIIYKITRLEERILYFDGFSKATRYPWFRELLKLAIRNSVCQRVPIVYFKSKKKLYRHQTDR